MARNQETSAVIDGLLRFIAVGGILSAALIAPNIVQAFDKPLNKYFNALDKRARQRELNKHLRYMRSRGLIKTSPDDYRHGIHLTAAGKERAERADIDNLSLTKPLKWDKTWRIVFFDIPESQKASRDRLSKKLKELGFVQLQRSVWVHPFECRNELEVIGRIYDVAKYISLIETNHIDSQEHLIGKFHAII